MPAQKIVSEEQWEILLEFMEDNPLAAKGCRGSNATTTNQAWAALAIRLNTAAGCRKSPGRWREYWNCMKYLARRNFTRLKQAPIVGQRRILAERELRILNIIGHLPHVAAAQRSVLPREADYTTAQKAASEIQRPRKHYRPPSGPAPDWLLKLEVKRLASDENMTRVLETISQQLTRILAALEARRPRPGS